MCEILALLAFDQYRRWKAQRQQLPSQAAYHEQYDAKASILCCCFCSLSLLPSLECCHSLFSFRVVVKAWGIVHVVGSAFSSTSARTFASPPMALLLPAHVNLLYLICNLLPCLQTEFFCCCCSLVYDGIVVCLCVCICWHVRCGDSCCE